MSHATCRAPRTTDLVPSELLELQERVWAQPERVRADLGPIVEQVLEHAVFRSRILTVARDALASLRHDLELARFDLDATRKEREALAERLQGRDGA